MKAFFWLKIAQCLFYWNKDEKAITILKKVLEHTPYGFGYFHLGWKLLELQQREEALGYLKKAVECDGQNAVFRTFLGMALCDEGKYEEANGHLSISLKLDPTNVLTHNCVALYHLKQGNFENFAHIIQEKGIFENSHIQSRILLALETYRQSLLQVTKS